MITCPVCASPNEAEAAFCGTCGAPLTTPEAARASGEAAPSPTPQPPATPDDDTVVPRSRDLRGSGKDAGGATAPTPHEPPQPPRPEPRNDTAKPEPPGVTCPTCGTRNELSRDFCRKCATELHPTTPKRKSVVNGGFIARFLISFGVSVAVVAGGATLLLRPANAAAGQNTAPLAITDDSGAELEIGLVPADPVPLEPLPVDSTIQLVSYKAAAPTTAPDGEPKAAWWNSTAPRVPAVTQFDGGPLQKHNCTMASGAMLARLAFGIVTTGSQLRALQDDQDGSSSFGNLGQALKRGWGVKLHQGALSPLQFRALLYAGAGAIVSVNYGEIPVGVRLQESYTGGHVIYIDAFRPPGPDGPAAYFVMDPIGHTWQGYKGEWWPAEDVERAATARYNGKMATAWAFAGGVVPQFHKNLPFDAYPGASPGTPATPGIGDPMPSGDLPLPEDPSDGGKEPDGPRFPRVDFLDNVFEMDSGPSLPKCAIPLAPVRCPKGVIGVLDPNGLFAYPTVAPAPTGRLLTTDLKLLYGSVVGPGTYQIIFESPPDADAGLWLWGSDGGKLAAATVESGLLKGEPVSIATVTLDPTKDYSFYATATGDGYRTTSTVGTINVTQ